MFTMTENTTHAFGSGAAISERPEPEVGLNKTRNCPRNRARYRRRQRVAGAGGLLAVCDTTLVVLISGTGRKGRGMGGEGFREG